MAVNTQLSVRAIKGKFEQMQDLPFGGPSPLSSGNCSSARRNRSYFASIDPNPPAVDSPLLLPEEGSDETSRLSELRSRSHSVGNSAPSVYHRNSGNDSGGNGSARSTGNKLARNPSLSRSKENNMEPFPVDFPNNNFNSFTEKQKLVESIVMNIKNSAVSAKRKDERDKDFKSKESLNITSKFEKDLKNVLERGVRKKWTSKSLKEGKHSKDSYEEKDGGKHDPFSAKEIGANHKKSFSKINAILGVDLYPIRPSVSDEIDSRDGARNEATNYPILKSESSPIMFNKSSNRGKSSGKLETHHQLFNDSLEDKLEAHHSETREDTSYSPPPSLENSSTSPGNTSPVRPPRRRRLKKGKAPLPPSPRWGSGTDNVDSPAKPDDQISCEMEEKCLEEEERRTRCDDSAFFALSCETTRRLSADLSKEFDYEDRCEKTLEGDTFLFDRETIDRTFNDSFNASHNLEGTENLSPSKWMSQSDSSLGVSTSPLPAGVPPKKPPRTFAYDIYRSLKPERAEKPQFSSTPKLSPEELESLYTKPLKRLKDKTSPLPLPPPPNKPAIAPKPIDIINKAKKRLSVVEPLPSAAQSKEFPNPKASVKRNSSFRFSFRKQKKSSVSPSRQVAPRKEGQVERRLRTVARTWHPRKAETEKRVRFHHKQNSQVIYNDVEGGPIYATPTTTTEAPQKEEPKELHYMCSPLFQKNIDTNNKNIQTHPKIEENLKQNTEDRTEGHKENLPPIPHLENLPPIPHMDDLPPSPTPEIQGGRLGIMDGLKEELRQSCRFVQKRLKGATLSRDMR